MEEHIVISRMIVVLNHLIRNRTEGKKCLDRDVEQLENMLSLVRSQVMRKHWEGIVNITLELVNEHSVSVTFSKIIQEMNSCNVYHLFTLYALFVDVISFRVQNNLRVNIIYELGELHYVIHSNIGTSVLKSALSAVRS